MTEVRIARRGARRGRPKGSTNLSAAERIARRLGQIYDALLQSALAGDAAAATVCLDIVRNPGRYPQAQRRQAQPQSSAAAEPQSAGSADHDA